MTRSPYFVSLPVDFLLIGGASIALFLLLPVFQDGTRTTEVVALGAWLSWVANWPHFAATNLRLYGRREHLLQYPITAVAAPLIVLAGTLGSFAWPLVMAPLFVKLYLLWSPFHYSGQTFGISQVYARRAGYQTGRLDRFLLTSFVYGTFVTRALFADTKLLGQVYYGVQLPGFGLPPWLATVSEAWTYACGAALVVSIAARALRERKAPPLMYLLPAVTQYVWFFVAGVRRGSFELVPFFHGVQYLLIAWAMQVSTRWSEQGGRPTGRFLTKESVRWYAQIFVLGAVLFYVLPRLTIRLGVPATVATAVILAAVQIHHFFVDGVIWKLKTRSVASPLLVNIPELAREPTVAAA